MKLFKSVDEKLEDLGFKLVKEDEHGVYYERFNDDFKFTHCVDICRKTNGNHLIQSYDKKILVDHDIYANSVVGLTYKELCLFTKKMKQILY